MVTFYFPSVLSCIFSPSNIPLYLQRLLQLNSEHHSSFNSPLSSDYLFFPIHCSTKFHAVFFYTSVKYFNSLPNSIKTSPFRSAASRHSQYLSETDEIGVLREIDVYARVYVCECMCACV